MRDFTESDILGLAEVAGIPLVEADLPEYSYQLNALLEAFNDLPLEEPQNVPPIPLLQYPQAIDTHEDLLSPPLLSESREFLAYKPITELSHLIQTHQLSPVELTDLYLERVQLYDDDLKSYITVTSDFAREQALTAEANLRSGKTTPLTGVPLAHKDEFWTKGIRTTCGSSILSDFVPDADAAPIANLHDAGAVMLGKLNMTEWASPSTWEFPYGQPRNPWSLQHDAGGSSTGSGSATAAGLCAGSIGEDTGGSIRRPASSNSCVGIRPSLGRVSTYGLIGSVWYQDTAGPLARSVADCALLMNAISGYDYRDPVSADLPVPDFTTALHGDVRGVRVGVIREPMGADHIDNEVKIAIQNAVGVLRSLGAHVEEVSIPLMVQSGIINPMLGGPRAALHWEYLKHRSADYDVSVRRLTTLPAIMPSWLYQRALQLRSILRAQVLAATSQFDVLISPSYPTPPPLIVDTKLGVSSKEDALKQMHKYSFATIANYAGIPAMSVPAGFSSQGLPIGMQIVADRFDEWSIFRVAHAFETATEWHLMHPAHGRA